MSELADLPTHVLEIIHRDLKDNKERILVAQIMHNYYVRGLLWGEDETTRQGVTDSTIAVTELVVLTNCLRNLNQMESV
jgi:hypothetical protein